MTPLNITGTPIIQQLEQELSCAPNGLPRVAALNAWCWEAWCYNPLLAWKRVNEAQQLADSLWHSGHDVQPVLAESLLCKVHLLIRMKRMREITSEVASAALVFNQSANVYGTLRCYWLQALHYAALAEEGQSLSLLQSLLQEPAITEHPLVLGRVQLLMGSLLMRMGEGQAAISHLEAAANTFSDACHPLLQGQALAEWTNALLLHDRPRAVIDLANSALPLQRHQMDWYSQVITLQCVIRAHLHLEDVPSARQYLSGYAMISHYIESILGPHYQLMLQAKVEHKDGNLQQADAYITSALSLRSDIIGPYEAIKLYETAAMIYEAGGKYEQALKCAREAARIQRERLSKARQNVARAVHLPSMMNIVNRTIAQQQSTANQLRARLDELSRLLDMFSEVASNLNVGYVASLSLDAAMRLSNADAGFFAIFDGDMWRLQAILGSYESLQIDISDVLQHALEARRVIVLPQGQVNVKGLPVYPPSRSRILVPLYVATRLIGLLNIETTNPQRFNAGVCKLVETMQSFVAIALDNALLYEHMARQNQELTTALAHVTRLENLKTNMIRLASHDLKQPLTSLNLYLSMIKRELGPQLKDTHRSHLDAMKKAITHMEQLIEDILSLERIEQIALKPPDDTFDLLEICRDEVQRLRPQADKKQQTLTFETSMSQALVRGDRTYLSRAVDNLINNALKYTRTGGKIQVRLYAVQQQLRFEVEDNGVGISPDDQPHIFKPSYRASNPLVQHVSGTGWGLYLVKKIVETHNGTVGFNSQLGVGSTFFFCLPLETTV
jgi:signal transduction histidine kinase